MENTMFGLTKVRQGIMKNVVVKTQRSNYCWEFEISFKREILYTGYTDNGFSTRAYKESFIHELFNDGNNGEDGTYEKMDIIEASMLKEHFEAAKAKFEKGGK